MDVYEVDQALLDARVHKIAQYAIAYLVTAFIVVVITAQLQNSRLFTIAAYGMPFSILPMIFFPMIDSAVAEKTADIAAVNAYLTVDKPSAGATRRIQSHIRAAELYVAKGGDVNKRNAFKAHLLSHLLNRECDYPDRFKVFKLLIDKGADILATTQVVITNFDLAVSNPDPAFLEYLVKQKKVKKEDVEADQFNHWLNIGHPKSALLLKELGLDINIQKNGKTALQTLSEGSEERPMNKAAHIKALTTCLSSN
jgi:hypothetical protein